MDKNSTICVKGHAKRMVHPDIINITIKCYKVVKDYDEACKYAAKNQKTVNATMEQCGLDKKLAKSNGFKISKKEEWKRDKTEFVGYLVDQTFHITIDINNKLLTDLLNNFTAQLKGAEIDFKYDIKDKESIKKEILRDAVLDATEQANIIADAAGCTLEMVDRISSSETRHNSSIYVDLCCCLFNQQSKEADFGSLLDVEPGDVEVENDVDITWYLVKK